MDSAKMAVLELRQDQLERSVDKMVLSNQKLSEDLNSLTLAISESVSQQKNVSANMAKINERIEKTDNRVLQIEQMQASFKPWVDLVQTINGRVWIMLMSSVFASIGSIAIVSYMLTKG